MLPKTLLIWHPCALRKQHHVPPSAPGVCWRAVNCGSLAKNKLQWPVASRLNRSPANQTTGDRSATEDRKPVAWHIADKDVGRVGGRSRSSEGRPALSPRWRRKVSGDPTAVGGSRFSCPTFITAAPTSPNCAGMHLGRGWLSSYRGGVAASGTRIY